MRMVEGSLSLLYSRAGVGSFLPRLSRRWPFSLLFRFPPIFAKIRTFLKILSSPFFGFFAPDESVL